MRRGLLSWSRDEAPVESFNARLAAVQKAMGDDGCDALLIYSDFTRPSAVSRLCHFIPYWNRAVLVVTRDRPLALICALSNRGVGWIRETSTLEDVLCTQDLSGAVSAKLQDAGIGAGAKIGVVELDSFPRGVLEAVAGNTGVSASDATLLFEDAMASAPGVGPLLAQHAIETGEAALLAARQAFTSPDQGPAALAAAELAARNAGAEEVLIAVAPDAKRDTRLQRIDGTAAFGDEVFLRISVAYKGYWHRIGTTLHAGGAATEASQKAESALREASARNAGATDPQAIADRVARSFGAESCEWTLEGAWAGLPLARLAGSGQAPRAKANGLVSLTVRIKSANGQWYGACPIVTGKAA